MGYKLTGDDQLTVEHGYDGNYKDTMADIGEALGFVISHRGMTETQLQYLTGTTRQFIHQILSGQMGFKSALRVARVLGLKVKITFEF